MKRLVLGCLVVAFAGACGSSVEPESGAVAAASLMGGEPGDPVPVDDDPPPPPKCDANPANPDMQMSKTRVYAIGSISCGTVTLPSGRWLGAQTFTGVPGMCTFDFTGAATTDFQGLRQHLPFGTTLVRADCGAIRANAPNAKILNGKPEGSTSCGASCTPVGMVHNNFAYVVLPPSKVKLNALSVRLLDEEAAARYEIESPATAQLVQARIDTLAATGTFPIFLK
jgi:hypothetical protein